MKRSPGQDRAATLVARWMRDPSARQDFYLAGYAGTGKTTLSKDLVGGSKRKWLFGAYTGKAAHVLRQKGCDGASTLHSLVYRPAGEVHAEEIAKLELELAKPQTAAARRLELAGEIVELRKESGPRFALWTSGALADSDVAGIVVDEVSMVDEKLGRDLESFGKKILVLGDPAQLPPVRRGEGYFTAREPDVMLTEVHRQARESGVLRLATHIREGGSLGSYSAAGDGAELLSYAMDREERTRRALAADQVLCGLNKTRQDLNQRFRSLKERSDRLPVAGDRLVCLRNERESGLFNGSQWVVLDAQHRADKLTSTLSIRSEDDGRVLACEAWLHHFLGRGAQLEPMGMRRRAHSEFDFGYALTCHKAQGSQWNRVLVIDESTRIPGTEPRRWLYTAITRAAHHVAVLA